MTGACASRALLIRATRLLPRPRQRAVDHGHRIGEAIDRDERAEARAFFLTEQHLIEHVEPVERHARPPILALLYRVKERLAPANPADHVPDFLPPLLPPELRPLCPPHPPTASGHLL